MELDVKAVYKFEPFAVVAVSELCLSYKFSFSKEMEYSCYSL